MRESGAAARVRPRKQNWASKNLPGHREAARYQIICFLTPVLSGSSNKGPRECGVSASAPLAMFIYEFGIRTKPSTAINLTSARSGCQDIPCADPAAAVLPGGTPRSSFRGITLSSSLSPSSCRAAEDAPFLRLRALLSEEADTASSLPRSEGLRT